MWIEGEICEGTSAPKTLPPAASKMCKRGMRILWGSRKNAAARKILQQEGDPLQRLWWSYSVAFIAGARTIPVYKRHKTVPFRLRGNISQVTMLLNLVTLLRCGQYCRVSKEKWTAFSRTRARWNKGEPHPRRPRGRQSGREKRWDESFQVRAEEPLGTDSHRTISKNSSGCRLLIGHKKCFVLLCPIGEQFLLSSFREFVLDG